MSKRGNATLIGAFVVGGILLVVAAIIAAGGGKLFARKERVVMHFSGSIYGLQVGAPVVFRGVRLGSVTSVGLVYDNAHKEYIIPVLAEIEPGAIRGLDANGRGTVLQDLVARGLQAQLSMQSLLTGQLYVDLDLRPDKPGAVRGDEAGGTLEIPTSATAIQNLKNQIDGLDFRKLIDDVSAIATSARALVTGPQLEHALDDLAAITANMRSVTKQLDQRFPSLAASTQATLAETRKAATNVGDAAKSVTDTAQRFSQTADRVGVLLAPDSQILQDVQRTAAELARTAAELREQLGSEAGLTQNTSQAMKEFARAARSVRQLADLLEQHPDALLRGRASPDAAREAPAPTRPEPKP